MAKRIFSSNPSSQSEIEIALKDLHEFEFFHLIKFEKPSTGLQGTRSIDYAYLTDASIDYTFEGNTYKANKVISVGDVSETVQARASNMNLVLSANGLGAQAIVTVTDLTGSGAERNFSVTVPLFEAGFAEGDKVKATHTGNSSVVYFRINKFTGSGSGISVTMEDAAGSISGEYSFDYYSEEVAVLTSNKTSLNYLSYVNREVEVYKVHLRPGTNDVIGEPFIIFKGIISKASLTDKPSSGSTITWNLSSHWGDFVRVQGRLTSDSFHRALGSDGSTDLSAVLKPAYATDKGFEHSEKSVNLIAQYTGTATRMVAKRPSGWFQRAFGMKEFKEEKYSVQREMDLRFNLDAQFLPVIYGVQKVDAFPVFADLVIDAVDGGESTSGTGKTSVYIAHAICEGEISAIYDMHVEGETLICTDEMDFTARSSGTEGVVCYGLASKGQVLEGEKVSFIDPLTGNNVYVSDLEAENAAIQGGLAEGYEEERNYNTGDLVEITQRSGASISSGISRDYGINSLKVGDKGIRHGYNFSDDNYDITFYAGKANQSVDPTLRELSAARKFKFQQEFYEGDPSTYWDSTHRLLDTAYVVTKATITEAETRIPTFSYVVRGKYLNCYNYDYSFRPAPTTTPSNASLYELGETVALGTVSSSGTFTTLTSSARIIDKWEFLNNNGELETRFRWSGMPAAFTDGSAQRLFMRKTAGGGDWVMEPYNYVQQTETPTTGATDISNTATGWTLAVSPTATYNFNYGKGAFQVEVNNVAFTYPAGFTATPLGVVLQAAYTLGETVELRIENLTKGTTLLINSNSYDPTNGRFFFATAPTALVAWANNWNAGDSIKLTPLNTFSFGSTGYVTSNATYKKSIEFKKNLPNGAFLSQERSVTGVVVSQNTVIFNETFDWDVLGSDVTFAIAGHTIFGDGRVSINPAIQVLDYLTNKTYGRGLKLSEIDLESFKETARACDSASDVTIQVAGSISQGEVGSSYTINNFISGELQFEGTISSISYNTVGGSTYSEITFTDVIGKLARKFSPHSTYNSGEYVTAFDNATKTYKVYRLKSGITNASIATNVGVSANPTFDTTKGTLMSENSIILAKVGGGGTLAVSLYNNNTFASGYSGNANCVIKRHSAKGFVSDGYSLYDSDDVKYWKYLGWENQLQREVTRHQTNMTIDTSVPMFDLINGMLDQFNGVLRYANGKYGLGLKTKAKPIETFDSFEIISEEDIIGEVKVDDRGIKDTYNAMSASIIDPQNKFEPRSISFFNSDFLIQDRNITKQGNYPAPGVSNYFNARMNVKQALEESRFGLAVGFKMSQKGMLLLTGSIIALNYNKFNWENKLFRIESLTIEPSGLVNVVAREHRDDAYLIDYVASDANVKTAESRSRGYSRPGRVEDVVATSEGKGGITLTWKKFDSLSRFGISPLNIKTEIWVSEADPVTGDDLGSPIRVATVAHDVETYTYQVTASGTIKKWFWLRHVVEGETRAGRYVSYSDWQYDAVKAAIPEPTYPTSGVSIGTLDALFGQIVPDSSSTIIKASDGTYSAETLSFVVTFIQGAVEVAKNQYIVTHTDGTWSTTVTDNRATYPNEINPDNISVVATAAGPILNIVATYNDQVSSVVSIPYSFEILQEGGSGLTIVLSRDSALLPTTTVNEVEQVDYANSGTLIYVYEGKDLLQYDGVGTSPGTWTVSAVGTSITVGAITDAGAMAQVANHSGILADSASVTYTITGQYKDGTPIPAGVTKVQSIAKALEGPTGPVSTVAGPDGKKTVSGYLWYAQTVPDPQNPPAAPAAPTNTTYTWSTGLVSDDTTEIDDAQNYDVWRNTSTTMDPTADYAYWSVRYYVTEAVGGEATTAIPNGNYGTVQKHTNFDGVVSFTDLSTSGKTIINGNNITTGNIQSSNYTDNTSSDYSTAGSKFNLSDGTIETPYFYSNSSGAGFAGTLEAGLVRASVLEIGATDLVNPVTRTNNINRWGGVDDLGNIPTWGVDRELEYNATEDAMALHAGATVTDVGTRSEAFSIDHNSIYRFSFKLKESLGTSAVYAGIGSDTVKTTGATGWNNYVSPLLNTFYDTDRVLGSSTNFNAFLMGVTIPSGGYSSFTFYIIGANRSVSECPDYVSDVTPSFPFIKLHPSANYVFAKFLNYASTGDSWLYIKDVSIQELGTGVIVADNIKAGTIDSTRINVSELLAVTNTTTGNTYNESSSVITNPYFTRAAGDGRPDGVKAVYGSPTPTNISYLDANRTILKLSNATDDSIGAGFPAFRIDPNVGDYRVIIRWKASEVLTSGIYFRMQELDSELPQGITHISTNDTSSEAGVIAATRQVTIYYDINNPSTALVAPNNFENAPLGTSWEEREFIYRPTATAKWVSPIMLRWSGAGSGKELHVDFLLVAPKSVDLTDGKIGGTYITPTSIYNGTETPGVWNSANTNFYLDSTGKFSLRDKLSFDASAADPELIVKGTITPSSLNLNNTELLGLDLPDGSVGYDNLTASLKAQLDSIATNSPSTYPGDAKGTNVIGSPIYGFLVQHPNGANDATDDKYRIVDFNHGAGDINFTVDINSSYFSNIVYPAGDLVLTYRILRSGATPGTWIATNAPAGTLTLTAQFISYLNTWKYSLTTTQTYTIAAADLTDGQTYEFRFVIDTIGSAWADSEAYIKIVVDATEAAEIPVAGSENVTFESLNANGDVGTGADQVARGDHVHSTYAGLQGGGSILEGYVLSPTPEEKLTFSPYAVNDLGFARLRGSAFTFPNGNVLSNTNIDNLFNGTSLYASLTGAFFGGSPYLSNWVIEFDTPTTLAYATYMGIGFGARWNRAKYVKLEAFYNSVWTTALEVTDNADDVVFAQVPGVAGLGVTKMRITLGTPNNTGSGEVRLAHIFAYNYVSPLMTTLYPSRMGGTFYGNIDINGNQVLDKGMHPVSGDWWGDKIPVVNASGVMEIGRHIDFHNSDTATTDYDGRLQTTGTALNVDYPGQVDALTVNNNKVWHAGNDGDGSTLDADKLDGVEGASFLRSDVSDNYTAGTLTFDNATGLTFANGATVAFNNTGAPFTVSSTTKVTNLNADYLDGISSAGFLSLPTDGVPRSNLGTPTTFEAAAVAEQFGKKTDFHPENKVVIETSTNGSTWTTLTTTTTERKRLVGGDLSDLITIPNGTAYFRVRFIAAPSTYTWISAAYLYADFKGSVTQFTIRKKNSNTGAWSAQTSSTTQVGGQPAHIWVPFSFIRFNETNNAAFNNEITVEAGPIDWTGAGSNPIYLEKAALYGGYPYASRYPFTVDEDKNITSTAKITAGSFYSTGLIETTDYFKGDRIEVYDTVNTTPAANYCRLNSYGLHGNRVDFYITNNSTDASAKIQLGIGGTHSAGSKVIIDNSWTNFNTGIKINGTAFVTTGKAVTASSISCTTLDATTSITTNGSVTAQGNVTAYSDMRLKENIETLDGNKVLEMRGVSFTKDGEAGSGVIAQELEKVAPELVATDDKGLKSVAYGNIVGYLIEGMKKQQTEIDELKALVAKLMEKL